MGHVRFVIVESERPAASVRRARPKVEREQSAGAGTLQRSRSHYSMQIRISQISCIAAGYGAAAARCAALHGAIAAINNPPCYKPEPPS